MRIGETRLTRRALLVAAAGSIAGSAAGALSPAGMAWKMAGVDAPGPLEEFGYAQVRVTGERQLAQVANVRAILLGLKEDSLLKPFREMSGQPGPGQSLGGWYEWKPDYDYRHDDAGLAPASTFGQWTSAMARLHAATGEAVLGERAVRLHGLLAETIARGGFAGYFAQTRFPAYSFDKLVCGLMDAHRLAGDPTAWETLDKVRAAAEPALPGRALDREMKPSVGPGVGRDISWTWDESYTMPENLFLVSAMLPAPAGARYRAMAEAYLDDASYFAPLARGENVLGGKQAYSYVNALCSAMQAYLTGGSAMHFDAAHNGFALLEQQSFATGGWGPDELLGKPGAVSLAKSLLGTHAGFETPCGSYAHMKLTRYLLCATHDGRYGDSMERVMLNTVLGALPLEADGRSFYCSDYNVEGKRVYSVHRWPCCSGTLPQVVADYGINTYFYQRGRRQPQNAIGSVFGGLFEGLHKPSSVWVNLYQPSTLRWVEGGTAIGIEQDGDYPETGDIRLRITVPKPVKLEIRLRVPAWAKYEGQVRINGIPWALAPMQGFVGVTRHWHGGDTIEMTLPLALRLEPLTGDPGQLALMWGPLVLFPLRVPGDGSGPLRMTSEALLGGERMGPRAWRVKSDQGERIFVPFTEVGDRSYSTYVNVRVS